MVPAAFCLNFVFILAYVSKGKLDNYINKKYTLDVSIFSQGYCPLPSNLKKHVYSPPEGNEDKLTLEKALEISKARSEIFRHDVCT